MNPLLLTLRSLGPARLAIIGLVGAISIGFFAYLSARIATPSYGLLYADLELRDSGQIVQKLESLNIPYQVRGDGSSILVPTDQVARLRIQMAEAGLPRGGSVGYEIFDKGEGIGSSSFLQNVNQVRALEGELARTIASIGAIQSARVHIVMPRRELFSREKQEPSASIVLRMRGADRLAKGQVASIQHLTAAAVPGLRANRISIVDGEGNMLARGGDDANGGVMGSASNAEEMRVSHETRLARTVEEMLERTLGPGKARVEVRADMDFDRITTNSESFDPEGQVVRSTQTVSESSDSSEGGDSGVTVANNLPDAQKPKDGAAGPKSKNARSEETVNYEVSKTQRTHVREAGNVKRLSVAVLVDGVYVASNGGAKAYQPRPTEEMEQIKTLVRSAIGFDAQRGDAVEVVNLRFAGSDEPPVAETSGMLGFGKSDMMRMGEILVLALLCLTLVFFVARPLIARVASPLPATANAAPLLTDESGQPQAALPPPAGGLAGVPGAQPGGVLGQIDGPAALEQMIDLQQVDGAVRASSLRKIGELVDKNPEEAVSVIRSWMYQRA